MPGLHRCTPVALAAGNTSSQTDQSGDMPMSTIAGKDGTTIFYKDWGKGPVVTFSHGWPLNADMWDGQMPFLADHGFRVVAHDRRGHGRSGQASRKARWISSGSGRGRNLLSGPVTRTDRHASRSRQPGLAR